MIQGVIRIIQYTKIIWIPLLNIYFFLLGLGWIILHLYLRLFRKLPTYTISEIKPYLTSYHYILFGFFILLHIILIMISLWIIFKKTDKESSFLIVRKIKQYSFLVINHFYIRPFELIINTLGPKIPHAMQFYLHLETLYSKNQESFAKTTIFILNILPRILLALIFTIELVIFDRIQIFTHSLGLVFIPILFNIFLAFNRDFIDKTRPLVLNYFSSITPQGDPIYNKYGEVVGYSGYCFTIKPEYEDVVTKKEAALSLQIEHSYIVIYTIIYRIKKISPYITIITSSLYLIGGLYRFYSIL